MSSAIRLVSIILMSVGLLCTPTIKIVQTTRHYNRTTLLPFDTFTMAKCLIGKNTAATLFTGTQEKQNIRKMVNKVVWELGTQSIQVRTKVKNSWIVDWARWKIQLDNAMGKECTKLNAAAESCLKGIKDEVGPPLNPTDGRYSSSAKDLRGDDYHFQGIDKSKC